MMRDEGLMVEPGQSAAESAVSYILQRMRVDVDLRYHLLGTEAWAKLCVAEAHRTGETVDLVRRRTAELLPHCRHERPQVVKLREELECVQRSNGIDDVLDMDVEDAMADVQSTIAAALDLCGVCAGLPPQSINRCPMCRKLQELL